MRDLMKRLDRLEQLSGATRDLPVIFMRSVGPKQESARTAISCGDEVLTRATGESVDDFKDRAIAHFEPRRLPRCGLVLLMKGDECAT